MQAKRVFIPVEIVDRFLASNETVINIHLSYLINGHMRFLRVIKVVSSTVYLEISNSNCFQQQTSCVLSASGNSHSLLIVLDTIQCFQEVTGLLWVHQACVSCRQILPRVAHVCK